jgi:hypothetical protein
MGQVKIKKEKGRNGMFDVGGRRKTNKEKQENRKGITEVEHVAIEGMELLGEAT